MLFRSTTDIDYKYYNHALHKRIEDIDVKIHRYYEMHQHITCDSWENLDNAAGAYEKLIARIAALRQDGEVDMAVYEKLKEKFLGALNGDLNTSLAITALYDVLKEKTNDATKLFALADFDKVVSLNLHRPTTALS